MIRMLNVCKSFQDLPVLRDITLRIPAGEAVALIGASGSGKTTLIRTLNGFVIPDKGMVSIAGRPINYRQRQSLRRLRKRIGMIYQLFNLVERASVLTNVLTGALGRLDQGVQLLASTLGFFSRDERQRAMDLLQFVQLQDKAGERVDRLSGGQKQRVAIARALMQEPDILLADEPVANLDPQTSRKIMELLLRINQEKGITLVTVLHHLDTVTDYFDRVIALKNGEVCYDGRSTGLDSPWLREIYGLEEAVCQVA